MSDSTHTGPMLAADGTPLKRSLRRALRAQKMRALALIAPLLIFVLLTFIAPIVDMLFRSVENQIVGNTLPMTVEELRDWDATEVPDEQVFRALFFDLFLAAEAKEHTKLGSRLNYEKSGISSLFRTSGRDMNDIGEVFQDALEEIDPAFEEASTWVEMMSGGARAEPNARLMSNQIARLEALEATTFSGDAEFLPGAAISDILPNTARAYAAFAAFTQFVDGKSVTKEEPWEAVYAALALDLEDPATKTAIASYAGPGADNLRQAAAATLPPIAMRDAFFESNKDWANVTFWETIKTYSPPYTTGYFLNAVDMEKTPQGIALRSEDERIYGILFQRTMFMSLMITFSCVALGYPVAWILANLPTRTANLLMILVLLPFWTSLLVRTSAWKVMLQQQGVINDVLVWLGLVADESRLVMINNQFGTIVAMTHILLPFMILPMYSVMQTIPPSYLRAAKSLGANNWTAFWRVYFPQSVPGIGAGSILVFILAIGYYITPEIVGGTTGTFISNRIAYHISSSLNWGLAAALGTILLAVVLILYWAYDKIVGIDNVKLG
ncbi:ABC-type spermidine/putrescine transport system, permease component I [Roseovarius mucosus DSM 17069]|uniref:ABC-type spermidine/putrescine transport system, permease component I n=1 Tax=Roseovarius mucosus DSM 17069 TaxID=1288298 RepID=A0A0A0HS88_9RHOB|nr:ABC transporter permease [Roseovarius mucosus]KGM89459.1 ABC-type spermidine/putrescine transport system, permease component I [Roseovarius mucosus DSM 17069]